MTEKRRKYPKIAKAFRSLRQERDTFEKEFTQAELSKKIGVQKPQISELENGKRYPSINEMIAYRNEFNVPIEYLIGLTSSREYENIKVGESLGLSDSAIETLKNWKKKKIGYSFLINTLISFGELFELLSIMDSYLFSNVKEFSATDYSGKEHVVTDRVIDRTDNDGKLLTAKQLENFRIFELQNNLIKMKQILKENNIIKYTEDNSGYVSFCENEHTSEEYATRIKQIQMCKEDE